MKTSRFLLRAAALLALGAAVGCGSVVTPGTFPEDDGAVESDALSAGDALPADDTPSRPDAASPVDAAVPPVDLGSPTDARPPFCALVDCRPGTRCCESLQSCLPGGVACPDDPADAGPPIDVVGPSRCSVARDCGPGRECVYPADVCTREGRCDAQIACLRPEAFCSCAGETYLGCRPDRPTRAAGPCATAVDAGPRPDVATSFCARALCMAGTRCCEALQACLPAGVACPTDPSDAGVVVRCRDNSGCNDRQYCATTTCGGTGLCADRPTACTREYDPVCGCDGRTHGNACSAAAQGVSIAYRGACASIDAGAPDTGVSFCATVRCVAGYRCCEARRACIPNDEVCPGDPVIDAGVRDVPVVRDTGSVGCASSRDCATGECVFPENACGTLGACMSQILCLRPETFCACSGTSYQSCRPDRPTRSRGACVTTVDAGARCGSDRECGAGQSCCAGTGLCYPSACLGCCMVISNRCTDNGQCQRSQYCAGSGCNTAGECATRPQGCPLVYNPVCGCDGRTYGNSCEAASNGVRVSASGVCRR